MPLAFRPPLSDEEQAILVTLPRLNGAVISPAHYPRHLRAAGEREFLAWCERHPPRDWPKWVADWHGHYHLAHRAAERQAGPDLDAPAGAGIPGGQGPAAVLT